MTVPCKLYFVLFVINLIFIFLKKFWGISLFFVILPLGNAELQVGSLLIPSITNN